MRNDAIVDQRKPHRASPFPASRNDDRLFRHHDPSDEARGQRARRERRAVCADARRPGNLADTRRRSRATTRSPAARAPGPAARRRRERHDRRQRRKPTGAFMGAGDDTFVWDPGDGSDSDRRRGRCCNNTSSTAPMSAEQVELSANGNRLRFFRNPGQHHDGHRRRRAGRLQRSRWSRSRHGRRPDGNRRQEERGHRRSRRRLRWLKPTAWS